jgi:hypothetical protein
MSSSKRFEPRWVVFIAVAAWISLSLAQQSNAQQSNAQQTSAQQIHPDAIPVKNWPLRKPGDTVASRQDVPAAGSTPGLVYIAITPCRVMDTRVEDGSGKTGAFGPPTLVGVRRASFQFPRPTAACPWRRPIR